MSDADIIATSAESDTEFQSLKSIKEAIQNDFKQGNIDSERFNILSHACDTIDSSDSLWQKVQDRKSFLPFFGMAPTF